MVKRTLTLRDSVDLAGRGACHPEDTASRRLLITRLMRVLFEPQPQADL
jgi:hypothetical protein